MQNDMILYHSLSGCGAVGSALDWGSRGREFKSRHSDHLKESENVDLSRFSGFFILPKKHKWSLFGPYF